MPFLKEWQDVYDKSILAFTGTKKLTGREIEAVTSPGPRNLRDSLAALDKTDPAKVKPAEYSAKQKAFLDEQRSTFIDEASAYKKVLEAAIAVRDFKKTHPDAYRELKVLLRHLDHMVAKVHMTIVKYSDEYQKAVKEALAREATAKQRLRDAGAGDKKIKKKMAYPQAERLLIGWPFAAREALTRAATAVQKIKADPSVKTYNHEMDHAGRGISQQFLNLIKMTRSRKCPQDLVRAIAGLDKLETDLKAFGGKEKRTVAVNTPSAAILTQLKEFSKLVKTLIPYCDKMTAYLDTHKE
jgi:hypothetical protein